MGGGLRQESQLGWSVKRISQTVLQQLSGAKHFSLLRFRFGHLVEDNEIPYCKKL